MDTFHFKEVRFRTPPFCPNSSCPNHDREKASLTRWFVRKGYFHTHIRGRIPRFKCRTCGRYCSSQTFCTSYCSHSRIDYHDIEKRTVSGSGTRQICRDLGITNRVLMNSQQRIARAYLHVYDRALDGFSIPENAAFDGFESFVVSQYTPVNYHILVGSDSQFIYHLNVQTMNRKGRRTKKQEANLKVLQQFWSAPRGGMTRSCVSAYADTLSLIADRTPENPWTLFTDMKVEYPVAMKRVKGFAALMKTGAVVHVTISSRKARTFANPLFPVNYSDREFRKNLAGHGRESVRFDREVNMAMVRMVIQIGNHSFRKPYRIGDKKDLSVYPTHAEVAGITNNPEVTTALRRMYAFRNVYSHQKTGKEWLGRAWLSDYANPPRVNFRTKEMPKKGQPGSRKLARHLVV